VKGANARAFVLDKADAVVTRSTFEGSGTILAYGTVGQCSSTSSHLRLADVVMLSSVFAQGPTFRNVALNVSEQAELTAERVWIEHPDGVAVSLDTTATATISDLTIRGSPRTALNVSTLSVCSLSRAEISSAGDNGVCVQTGSDLNASDLVIMATGITGLGTGCNLPSGRGSGLRAFQARSVEINSFRFDGNQSAGISVDNSRVSLQSGVITNSPVGAEITTHDDAFPLLTDVVYAQDAMPFVIVAP
jgi:hypothetical protein